MYNIMFSTPLQHLDLTFISLNPPLPKSPWLGLMIETRLQCSSATPAFSQRSRTQSPRHAPNRKLQARRGQWCWPVCVWEIVSSGLLNRGLCLAAVSLRWHSEAQTHKNCLLQPVLHKHAQKQSSGLRSERELLVSPSNHAVISIHAT